MKGLYGDNKSEKEKAFSNLERLKKKGTVTDYDMELASYRECAKSFRADYIITRNVNDYKAVSYTHLDVYKRQEHLFTHIHVQ